MIFPRKKVAPVSAPWWQASKSSKSSKGGLALIAVLAGAVGGILGVNASGASIFNRVNLVSFTLAKQSSRLLLLCVPALQQFLDISKPK